MKSFDVCVVGSANLDLVATTVRLPAPGETVLGDSYAEHPGGKGLNQAVAAKRAGARTAFCGAVGDDHAGQRLQGVLAVEGIDSSAIRVLPGVPTGRALIGVSATAENFIIVVPGANSHLGADDVAEIAARSAVVLVQLEVPVPTVFAALRAGRLAGAMTILNPAPAAELSAELLALCDIVVPNEHEAELLGGVDTLLGMGARAVVVTLGARGARLVAANGDSIAIEAFPVHAIDTTAAGDAFCGGFATALARRADYGEALRFGAATGALATTRAGAVPSLPHRAEIDALVTSR